MNNTFKKVAFAGSLLAAPHIAMGQEHTSEEVVNPEQQVISAGVKGAMPAILYLLQDDPTAKVKVVDSFHKDDNMASINITPDNTSIKGVKSFDISVGSFESAFSLLVKNSDDVYLGSINISQPGTQTVILDSDWLGRLLCGLDDEDGTPGELDCKPTPDPIDTDGKRYDFDLRYFDGVNPKTSDITISSINYETNHGEQKTSTNLNLWSYSDTYPWPGLTIDVSSDTIDVIDGTRVLFNVTIRNTWKQDIERLYMYWENTYNCSYIFDLKNAKLWNNDLRYGWNGDYSDDLLNPWEELNLQCLSNRLHQSGTLNFGVSWDWVSSNQRISANDDAYVFVDNQSWDNKTMIK